MAAGGSEKGLKRVMLGLEPDIPDRKKPRRPFRLEIFGSALRFAREERLREGGFRECVRHG